MIITLALLAFLPAEPAPETFSIKLYVPEKGDVKDVVRQGKSKVVETNKTSKAESLTVSRYSYKEEILEKDKEKPATKVKRAYSKARLVEDGKEQTFGFEGKEVLIEKKGEAYEFSIDGKALDKEDAAGLDSEWNHERRGMRYENLLPSKAVKLNETWQIDTALLIKDLEQSGLEGDPKNSKAAGKLVKTYRKGKQLFGVIQVDVELAVESPKDGRKPSAKVGSKAGLHLEIDAAIDGTPSEASTKLSTGVALLFETPGASMTVQSEQKIVIKLVK